MRRLLVPASAVLGLTMPLVIAVAPSAAAPGDGPGRPATYSMAGDAGGSKFEGIGVDPQQRTFYVSETTGGEIHRGDVRTGATEEWLAEGVDDRSTARGITTDADGRIYIAGGPNGLNNDRPDLWVYAPDGALLAALRVDVADAFLNDVVIGPDGAAYVTNSNAPQVFRVSEEDGGWQVSTWADATGTITPQQGFNLGGIVVSPNRRALVVAQGNAGVLWRFDLRTGDATRIDARGVELGNADGLVLHGAQLTVIRNFSRVLTTLRLDPDARTAVLLDETPTDPARVFTTGKVAGGRLLLVDSKFDEPVAAPPYEVVAVPLPR